MSDDTQTPYFYLGEKLRILREGNNESIADVSGAVEIADAELQEIERGNERPSEDILMLLFSHFSVEDGHASELWKLAGYEGRPHGMDEPPVQNEAPMHQHMMMVMMDPRIIYSDGVEVISGDRGVTVNFSQVHGPDGKPMVVSRVGMSRVQAEQLMGILHQVLYDLDNPQNKQLGSGDSSQ